MDQKTIVGDWYKGTSGIRNAFKRFWSYVSIIDRKGCWQWTGGKFQRTGYGRFFFRGTARYAHRFSYEIFQGSISKGFLVCHHCDNKLCVNPDHLFIGTYNDNKYDSIKKQRHAFGERHGRKKLTASQVLHIRRLLNEQSRSIADISREFRVTEENIRAIWKYKTWKHLI